MRFVALLLIFALVPFLFAWYKSNGHDRKWAYFALGALPFTISFANLDASIISWSMWPGYVKGLTITVLDSLSLAIILASRGPFRKLPFLAVLLAYTGASAVSMVISANPMAASFYVFQLLRVMLLVAAVATVVTQPNGARWLAFGLAAGSVLQAIMAVQDRLSGVFQASGSMGHQNLLGMMLHFVTLPLLALLLAGERSKLVYAGVVSGLVSVALGASRGSIGFALIGCAIVLVLSLVRGFNAHKGKVIGLTVLALAVVGPLMADSMSRRYEKISADDSGYDERAAFEDAARMMWRDHPMGVGANQYIVSANAMGYNSGAKVAWSYSSRTTNVHNLYLLAGSEMGYLGLWTLLALLIWPVLVGFRYCLAHRGNPRGDLVLGFSVAIFIVAIHSLYEWIFMIYGAQYMLAIALGCIAGFVREGKLMPAAKRSPAGAVPVMANAPGAGGGTKA